MAILKEYAHFKLCQDLYYIFCVTVSDNVPVHTTTAFLSKYQSLIRKYPACTHKIFQTVMEACYPKRLFNNAEIEDFFRGRILVSDTYQLNEGFSDMSTINTLLTIDYLISRGYFEDRPIIAYSTPLKYQTAAYKQRQQTCAQTYVQDSKAVTNNTNADLKISHRMYDFKDTTHTATAQSHIYPWT